MSMKVIAIDLLWLRPGKVGGTEFYIRNLLDGFLKLNEEYRFALLVSQDNKATFEHYAADKRMVLLETGVISAQIGKRILWQMFFQNHFLRKHGIRRCFAPVYCRPFFNGGIRYVNTIHDLQAKHYPEYHPFYEIWYSELCWWCDVHFSKHIVAISDWVRDDILQKYHLKKEKITTIYNPITVDRNDVWPVEELTKRFRVEENAFYYTIAQLIPHKNLETLIEVFRLIKEKNIDLPHKLLISGVGGESKSILEQRIAKLGLKEEIIFTGFVDNTTRNTLYRYARAFLFPSVFEGFGMPTIEAMLFGSTVIATDRTCIPEVTQGKANYVSDPYDAKEWIRVMQNAVNYNTEVDFGRYEATFLTKKYYNLLVKELND